MASSLKPYPAYKPTGVEWLGEVPAHWEVQRLKYAVSFTGGGTPSKANTSFWSGHVPWVSPKDMTRARLNDTADHISNDAVATSAASIVAPGAVLMVVRSGILRRTIPVAINTVPMALNQDMKALRPKNGIAKGEYLHVLIQGNESSLLREWTKHGATVESIEHGLLANSRIPVPPLPEQAAIARYLDRADRRIRRCIQAAQRQIELLEEHRQALVHEAVTGRVDVRTGQPYPACKPSGVEWLGAVPAHWEVQRLKASVNNVVNLTTDRRADEIYLALEHVEGWTGRIRKAAPDISFDSQVKRFATGDVLFGKLRPYLAKVTHPDRSGVCVGEFLVLRPRASGLGAAYLAQFLRSRQTIDVINASTFGAKMPRAEWAFIGSLECPLPPLSEQAAIVRYLDRADQRIRRCIQAAQRQIKLLNEYRTRLIADVVTGKLDVREAAVALPATDPLAAGLTTVPE